MNYSEHLGDPFDAFGQGVHLLEGVVEGEGGTHRALHAQAAHQRLGAMVPRAHGDAQAVEQRAHVQVVDAAHQEGDDGVPLPGLAQYAHAGNAAHALQCITGQFLLVRMDVVHAQAGDVIEGARQPRGGHVVGRAGLELERQFIEGGTFESDRAGSSRRLPI